jgi:hypothetical protein
MKFNIKNIAVVLLSSMALISCLPDKDIKYEGDTLVEFKNPDFGMLPAVLNLKGVVTTPAAQVQTALTKGILINTRTADTLLVQLVGPQKSQATTITYAIRSGSTAVEGTNFSFATPNARTVVIPANSSVGYLIVRPIANSITTVGDTRTLGIDMVSADGATVSPNYKSFTYSLKR